MLTTGGNTRFHRLRYSFFHDACICVVSVGAHSLFSAREKWIELHSPRRMADCVRMRFRRRAKRVRPYFSGVTAFSEGSAMDRDGFGFLLSAFSSILSIAA